MPILLVGIVAFVVFKAMGKPMNAGAVQNPRSLQSIDGFTHTIQRPLGGSPGPAGPVSGSNQIGGNANQPWYNGALVSGAGVAGSAIAKGLVGLFEGGDGEPDVIDDADLEASADEMGQSSDQAFADDEMPWDEESYDSFDDESTEGGTYV